MVAHTAISSGPEQLVAAEGLDFDVQPILEQLERFALGPVRPLIFTSE
jgi:hypothetical protein